MKRIKYFSILTLIFGAFAFACNEDVVGPLGGGDDEDDDPIVLPPPPPPPGQSTEGGDTLNI
ncbi:hypothetical protein JMN32_07215 [Fulvivirga sp. 29W222]|uniref:Uncharacterized protein n=1 Tax=Fulvivirga marina TaxID=2494733 RepID=A0A937KDI3_9BACT|nr:hypothetical protein [Fulvivirga marina]MBL6446090.1 hypothetical protein [Fulvivirga marina]